VGKGPQKPRDKNQKRVVSHGDAAESPPHPQTDRDPPTQGGKSRSAQSGEQAMVKPEGGTKRDPNWLFNIAVALFAAGVTLFVDEKQRVLGIPMVAVGICLFLISWLRSLQILWTFLTAILLALYFLLYLPRFEDRSADADWTTNPPLSEWNSKNQNEHLANNFDRTPPKWIRWLEPATLIWESYAPHPKIVTGLRVDDDHEIDVQDSAPVLFPPLSDSRKPINAFDMDLTFDLKNPQDYAAWTIRTDEVRRHYYLFVLARDESDPKKETVQIHAWKVAGNKGELIDSRNRGPAQFLFPPPDRDFSMKVHLEATRGCDFKYSFIFDEGLPDKTTCQSQVNYRVNDESCYLRGRPGLVDFGKLDLKLDTVPDSPNFGQRLGKGAVAKISDVQVDWKNGEADEIKCAPMK
jgi:hypothetical protein